MERRERGGSVALGLGLGVILLSGDWGTSRVVLKYFRRWDLRTALARNERRVSQFGRWVAN